MHNTEAPDEEFEALVRQAREDLKNPPPDGCFLGTLGCLGGTLMGYLFCTAVSRVLLLLDRAYDHPFDLNRPYGLDSSIIAYALCLGVLAMVLIPKIALPFKKFRQRQRMWEPKKRERFRARASTIVVVAALLCGVVICALFQVRRKKLDSLLPAIAIGELKPDSKGIVELPPRLKALSRDGKAYVTRLRKLLLVFLPEQLPQRTFIETFPLEGRLICSRPLIATDFRKGSDSKGIKINSPTSFPPYVPKLNDAKVERKIAGTHYFVSSSFFDPYARD